jgi:hypothetical protein
MAKAMRRREAEIIGTAESDRAIHFGRDSAPLKCVGGRRNCAVVHLSDFSCLQRSASRDGESSWR